MKPYKMFAAMLAACVVMTVWPLTRIRAEKRGAGPKGRGGRARGKGPDEGDCRGTRAIDRENGSVQEGPGKGSAGAG